MRVLLFGALAEAAQKEAIEMNEVTNTTELQEKVFEQYPELKKFEFMVAVNQEKVHDETKLGPADEVALLPPFAGG